MEKFAEKLFFYYFKDLHRNVFMVQKSKIILWEYGFAREERWLQSNIIDLHFHICEQYKMADVMWERNTNNRTKRFTQYIFDTI